MRFDVVTLFPELFNVLDFGVIGKAKLQNLVTVNCWNPRDFTEDKHKTVDDKPYGGGPGMVMMVKPLKAALTTIKAEVSNAKVIYLSPKGKRFTQKDAPNFLKNENIILVAGRYEGVDERLIASEIDEEWSIGDYVLSGGELAAAVLIDVVSRLIPGVLGDADSAKQDSFTADLLEFPQYTRPESIDGWEIPEILKSGNHKEIARWRLKQALGTTWLKRPDLLLKKGLGDSEMQLLMEFVEEFEKR